MKSFFFSIYFKFYNLKDYNAHFIFCCPFRTRQHFGAKAFKNEPVYLKAEKNLPANDNGHVMAIHLGWPYDNQLYVTAFVGRRSR